MFIVCIVLLIGLGVDLAGVLGFQNPFVGLIVFPMA